MYTHPVPNKPPTVLTQASLEKAAAYILIAQSLKVLGKALSNARKFVL